MNEMNGFEDVEVSSSGILSSLKTFYLLDTCY